MNIIVKIKQYFCNHQFKSSDLTGREEVDGENIKWPCYKCGKVFIKNCGLDVLKYGKRVEPKE